MSLSEFQFPTDNLYKFLALSGIAGLFVLPVYFLNEITERNHQFIQVETEVQILGVEFENLQDEVFSIVYQRKVAMSNPAELELLEQIEKSLMENRWFNEAGDPVQRAPTALAAAIESLDRFIHLDPRDRDIVARLRTNMNSLFQKSYSLGGMRAKLKLVDDHLFFLTLLLWIGTVASLCIANIGFFFWYFRIQRYQDQILRSQTEKGNDHL